MPTFYSLRSYQLLLAFALCSASMFAQSDSDIADLKKQKEALQLQLDVINIQKTLTAAQQAPSASSTQKDQLQAEKDIQDIKNSMAASQLARVKAEIGSINTTNLPKGDAVLTNVDIQPTILGYKALKKAITEIELTKNEFCPDGTRPIVLGSGPPEDVAVLSAYQAIIKIFSDNLGRLQSPPDYEHPAAMFVPPAAIFAGIDAVVRRSYLVHVPLST